MKEYSLGRPFQSVFEFTITAATHFFKNAIFTDSKVACYRCHEPEHKSKTLMKLDGGRDIAGVVEFAHLTRLLFV